MATHLITRQAPDVHHRWVFTLAIWLCPLQTMLFIGGMPYISPPSILVSALGLLLIAVGYRSSHVPAEVGVANMAMRSAIHVFCAYSLLHGLFVDMLRQAMGEVSVMTGEYLRQVMSLIGGLLIYEYFRLMLAQWGAARFRHAMGVAIRPHIVLGFLSGLGFLLGFEFIDQAVTAIRGFFLPSAEAAQNFRSTGLATEPSYFAILLAGIYLPAIFVDASRRAGWSSVFWLVICSGAIVFTFSLTGFVAIGVGVVYWAFCHSRKLFLLPILTALVGGAYLLTSVEGNYAALQLSGALDFADGNEAAASLSLLDTMYSYVGPFSNYSPELAFGVGLGGTETAISQILTDDVAFQLREAFGKDRIGVLLARVWVEQGLLGLLMFIMMWWFAWRQVAEASIDPRHKMILKTSIVVLFAGYAVKLGSLSLPYMWILFAYIGALPHVGSSSCADS
jgi:hypothetical protein